MWVISHRLQRNFSDPGLDRYSGVRQKRSLKISKGSTANFSTPSALHYQLIDSLQVEDILNQGSIPIHVQSNSRTNMIVNKKEPRQCALWEKPYKYILNVYIQINAAFAALMQISFHNNIYIFIYVLLLCDFHSCFIDGTRVVFYAYCSILSQG